MTTMTTEAAAALAATSTEGLLTTFAALTHQIHVADERGDRRAEDALRLQRAAVRDEVLRRTGDAR